MTAPLSRLLSSLVVAAVAAAPHPARAQACCAGGSAVTLGRLALHENALVGAQVQAGALFGAYDSQARFRSNPEGASAWDFEQDAFASLRVLRRGQVSALLPVMQSYRRAPTTGAELGFGVGDVNVSARYDFTWTREVSFLPGIAALAGVTLPTGRPPESAHLPLGSDATGTGALQLSGGLALERGFERFLVNATLLVAKRLPREVNGTKSELGTELVALAALAYVFPNEASLAAVVTGRFEGPASVDGEAAAGTARRRLRVSFAGALPLSDGFRAHGSLYLDPPVSKLGKNEPAGAGLTLAALWTFL